jgi:hypothetical protein
VTDRTPPQDATSPRARRIGLATLVVLVGTTLSIGWHYIAGAYLGLAYPMTSFLFIPSDRFNDLLNTIRDVRLFDAARGGVTIAYTPLQHAVLYLWIRLTRMLGVGSALLWLTMAAFFGLVVYFLIRFFTERSAGLAVNAQRVFILAALSYPVLWVLDRANTEMLVFAAVFGFVFFYYIKPNRWLWIACLAAAICLKIYPGVLILIPLSDRRFRDSAYTLAATVAATLASAWFLGLQSQYGFANVLQLTKSYLFGAGGQGGAHAIWWPGIQHGHSIWGASYLIDVLAGKPFSLAALQKAYVVFAAIAAVGGAAWTYFGNLRPWQKLTVVTFMYMLLPFSSHDYTLVHVFFPLALYVATEETPRFDRILTVLFGLLLVPLDYYYFIQNARFWPAELGQDAGWMLGMSVLVYPLIMLAILALIAFQSPRRGRAADGPPAAGHGPRARPRQHTARRASPSRTVDAE